MTDYGFTIPFFNLIPNNFDWGKNSQTSLNINSIFPFFGNNGSPLFNINTYNPLSWMYSLYPLLQSFNGLDFMSIMLQKQQQQWLSNMYRSGQPMNVGMPDFDRIKEMPVEELRQRAMSMPLNKECGNEIKRIAKELNCNPEDLLGVIYVESDGGKPNALNSGSHAAGLIQFMPSTLKWLSAKAKLSDATIKKMSDAGVGLSSEQMKNMEQGKPIKLSTRQMLLTTAKEQMPFVESYLKIMKAQAGFKDGEALDAGKLYGLVFMPGRVKNGVLCSKNDKDNRPYNQNRCLDVNGDGVINVADLYAKVKQYSSSAKKLLGIC